MFDWATAENVLYNISKKQIAQFLDGPERDEVYGFGFFCDSYQGSVYLVANTEKYHLASLVDYEKRFSPANADIYKWDIGNWKYPGGLFPSSSSEQKSFDNTWKHYGRLLVQMLEEENQVRLEEMCFKVLAKLNLSGDFLKVPSLKGLIILGPDDSEQIILKKKRKLDQLFQIISE